LLVPKEQCWAVNTECDHRTGTSSSILGSIVSMHRVTAKEVSKSVEISFPFSSKQRRHTPQVWAR
jgi:hypothetical protein